MARNPLHTKLCDMPGIEFPIATFTHCKDVAAAVINAAGLAVLGEAMHTPDGTPPNCDWEAVWCESASLFLIDD